MEFQHMADDRIRLKISMIDAHPQDAGET